MKPPASVRSNRIDGVRNCSADCQSAVSQIANLRHSRLPIGVTTSGALYRTRGHLLFALLSLLALAPLSQAQTNRPSGTIVWKELPYVEPGTRFTAISAGLGHSVALKNDGSVVAWGYNHVGQTTVPVAAKSGVEAIAAGNFHTVALKSDGSIVAWGDSGGTSLPVGLPPIFAIAAGNVTVALVRDPPPSLNILRNANETVSLSWTGVGTIEQSASLTAPNWQPASSQANPQTLSTTDAMKFFRVKAD